MFEIEGLGDWDFGEAEAELTPIYPFPLIPLPLIVCD